MAELSKMQRRIYDYIAACIQEQGFAPSVREIGEAVGLKSPSTVHFHLKRLEEAGVIAKGGRQGVGAHRLDRAGSAAGGPYSHYRQCGGRKPDFGGGVY